MKRKGLLSLLLCLTLVMGLPAAPALAVSVPWDGVAVDTSWYTDPIASDPSASAFTISDGADLAGLAELVNDGTATFAGKTITMADDIDLGGKLPTPSNWTPIGDETRHFLGNFDGDGHQVRNLYCSWTAPVNWPQVGLFGHLGNNSGNKATVTNLGVVDCAVSLTTGLGNTGSLVGYALNADISKCYVTGSVTSVSYAGGLAGGHANGLISDCYSTATVDGYEAGGLVGMGGSVKNSFFCGNMIRRFSTGGLVGFNPYSLTNCLYLRTDPELPAFGSVGPNWTHTETDVQSVPAVGFATPEAAYRLNTTNLKAPNSRIWSQGAEMPVYAGGSYLPIHMVTLAYSNGLTRYSCSRADGSILLPADPTDTVAGKTFLGWYTDGTYGTAFDPNSKFTLTADNTLTIHGNFGVRKVTLGDYSAPFSSSPIEYGGTVSDNASGIAGVAPLTYTYCTDLQGLNRTSAVNGAASDGAAPANTGTYYVRASAAATVTIDAAASNLATMTITKNQGGATLSITTGTLPAATVGGAYSQALVCSYSGNGTLAYSASGLPSGLTIDAATGVISGTPAAGADTGSPYSVTVGATDGTVATSKTFSLTVQPATAGAFAVSGGAPGMQYTYANNTLTLTQSGTYQISMRTGVASTTTDRIVVASGTTVNLTLNGVSIDLSATDYACAFSMAGATVNLTLANGTTSTLKSGTNKAGLFCPAGATLTISGSGELTVSGGDYGAGIGGAVGSVDGGTITIGGGTVTATGGSNCAGIGGGEEGSGGVITISAGTVTAQGNYGAGIGGGYGGNAKGGDGGRISITGGTVNATSTGDWSAGIGGGCGSSGGEITISGGLVTAGGGEYGPGIGSGSGASTYGTIRVFGGSVIANGGHYGAGIGSGQDCGDGTVEIVGGSVEATGGGYAQGYSQGAGAGIGGGNGSNGGTVRITGGTVTAVGGSSSDGTTPGGGAGIGGGRFGDGGTVYISGGNVKTISGGGEAQAIGKGTDGALPGTIQNNSTDLTDVYLTTITLANSSGSPIGAAVISALTSTWNGGGYLYGTTGMRTDADGRLYVYLPDGSRTTAARAGGADYLGDIATTSAGGSGTLTAPPPIDIGSLIPTYQATISGIGGAGTTLPISLDASGGRATLSLGTLSGSQIFGGGAATITVPPMPGANAYTLEMSATSLSGSQAEGTLSFRTSVGSVTLPADMLAGIPGTEGRTVGITVGQGNVSTLPDAVRAAVGNRPLIQLTCTLDGVPTPWNNPDAPVTVSVPYTPTAAELAHPEHIVVWYIDGSGNAIAVPNGRYDSETGMVTFTVTHFSQYAVAYVEKTFGDLGSVEWARESIEALASKGIINGTGENIYSPAARITRADYLVLLVKTLGLTADFSDNFDDVKPGAYYYDAVGIAKKLGIAAGSGNNRFNPGEAISRQDMMVLTARALERYKDLKAAPDSTVLDKYADKGDIADYAVGSLATLVKAGLITGSGDTINPLANTTRAEAAVFLYRIYNRS